METIFISIASYRDVLCSTTVRNIYENAKNPMNVFIGIVEQNNSENKNELCLSENLDKKFLNNIRITKIPYQDAKGPTFARYLCSQLYKNEDYFFQIDSHTLFVHDWDEKLLKMFKNTGNRFIEIIERSISKNQYYLTSKGGKKRGLASHPVKDDIRSEFLKVKDNFKNSTDNIGFVR